MTRWRPTREIGSAAFAALLLVLSGGVGIAACGSTSRTASKPRTKPESASAVHADFDSYCDRVEGDSSGLSTDLGSPGEPGLNPQNAVEDLTQTERDMNGVNRAESEMHITQQESLQHGWTTKHFDSSLVAKVLHDLRYHDVTAVTLQQDLNNVAYELNDDTTFCGNAESNGQ